MWCSYCSSQAGAVMQTYLRFPWNQNLFPAGTTTTSSARASNALSSTIQTPLPSRI
ncbi:hypothetical protein [Methanosarcina sp. UBA411]|uniref:hypothetical protein n=1 Tax=Methanosarcina sp. UBA411 TaxID=1915589 RepID=UPI0025EAE9D8|nr:hypothetical protein [Methanosarcina sp. UBA411]